MICMPAATERVGVMVTGNSNGKAADVISLKTPLI
jgi:hypothetical protein